MKTFDVGDKRFLMHVYFNGWQQANDFCEWMLNNYPDCMCRYRADISDVTKSYWEVRGNDPSIAMAIRLTWG